MVVVRGEWVGNEPAEDRNGRIRGREGDGDVKRGVVTIRGGDKVAVGKRERMAMKGRGRRGVREGEDNGRHWR